VKNLPKTIGPAEELLCI